MTDAQHIGLGVARWGLALGVLLLIADTPLFPISIAVIGLGLLYVMMTGKGPEALLSISHFIGG